MAKKNIFLLLFICSAFLFQSKAQDSYRSLKSEANEYFRIEEYANALPLYLKMDSLKADDSEVNYRIGLCYFKSSYKLKGLKYFEHAKRLMHKHHDMDLMLAKLYHLHHDFDKAIEFYGHHKKYVHANRPEGIKDLHLIDNYIAQCENAKEFVSHPLDYEIVNLGANINTPFSDYAPVISADETMLIFTSKRNTTTGGGVDDNNYYFEDVYVSYKDSVGAWGLAKGIGKPINTNDHDACIGLSPDGQKLFIYRSTRKHAEDIFVTDLEGATWKEPVKLGTNVNTGHWESHASITADEQTLYFTSSKPGGKGGKDIFVSKRLPNGEWGPPVDLSEKVNTEFDEDGPFIHPDGKTLFFSSMGHKSMGGYDIFKTVYDEDSQTWSEPENVGYPLNTADDDLFLVWSADGTRAYFSSIRPDSYGEKDIYMAKKKEVSNFVVVLKGKVLDKKTKKAVAATITVHNLTTNQMVGVFNSNSATGKYVVVLPVGKDFSVTAEAPGYVFHSEHVDVPKPDAFVEIDKLIELEPIGTKDKVATLSNVFFDYDRATLRPQSKNELDKLVKLLKENKDLNVEIAAHTDSVANDIYNMHLSNERAKSVVAYLVENGIDSTKLLPIGYGEDFSKASNSTADGRQLNRRSEFIFVNKFSPNRKENIRNSFYYRREQELLDTAKRKNEALAIKIADTEHSKEKLAVVRDNKYQARVYFAGLKLHSIADTSQKDLDELLAIWKENKNEVIHLYGYVDAKATDLKADLCKKRMDAIATYFEKKGVPPSSVSKKYMADKNPYASNASVDGKKLNRRVEVLVNIRHLED
jgi:outer membrane protein OmpA-like peptidoglycan-associated protein